MTVQITLNRADAEIFARALRSLDGMPDANILNTLSEIGHELGALMGMTSDSDDSDAIDEFVNEGDVVNLIAYSMNDNASTTAAFTF
jgi:hypothetical protein